MKLRAVVEGKGKAKKKGKKQNWIPTWFAASKIPSSVGLHAE